MSMAENNPLRSVPETSKESPVDPSSSTHRERTSAVHGIPERRRNIVILAVIAVVLIAGIFLWRYLSIYESTDDAQVDVHLYPVSARVSGYVVRVNVGDNQWVERGTVLVEIDPKDYGVAIAQAQASLANAQAIAESLNITVPITSVNTSSQLKFTASGI
jgi:membrane fusion protein (multidrug efflux system)